MITHLIAFFEIISVILFPLGQLARISFLNQQVSVYPYEISMGVALLLFIVKYHTGILQKPHRGGMITYFFASLFVSFVITAPSYSVFENAVGFMYFIRLLFYFIHFMYFSFHLGQTIRFRLLIRRELFFLAGIIIISSWMQYLYYPNLKNLLYMGWDPHLYRVFSFFFEPYLAGGALGLSFLFIFFSWKAEGNMKILKWSVLLILFVLIMLTFSRTVYIAFLMTSVLWLIKKRRLLHIAGIAVLFILVLYLIPKPEGAGVQLLRTFTINTRILNAKEGLNVWIKSPVFGIGYNRTRYIKDGPDRSKVLSHAAANYHSSFVTILATGGVVGFALYCAVLFSFMRISHGAGLYIIFLSILSLGDNAILHPFMMFMYFRLLGLEKGQSSLT